jgi:hypothetical protein
MHVLGDLSCIVNGFVLLEVLKLDVVNLFVFLMEFQGYTFSLQKLNVRKDGLSHRFPVLVSKDCQCYTDFHYHVVLFVLPRAAV